MPALSFRSKSVVTQHWKKRLIPCMVTLNEKRGKLRNKIKCSAHCYHPAPLSGPTLTLKWEWPHHTFSQIITTDMILTARQLSFIFFFGSPPFCFSLWFCALVIWPSRLYSNCEAEEQKDGSNSFCATPQARLFFPSLPITSRPDPASQQDPAPFSALAQTHHTPGGLR